MNINTLNTENDDEAEDAPVLTIALPDETGATHDVQVNAADWAVACALTPDWRIVHDFDKLQVITTAPRAMTHPKRSYKRMDLRLADFVALPDRGDTVRHLDGSTLNCTRANLVCRPKGARTIPSAPRPPTAKELRLEAIVEAAFERKSATSPPPTASQLAFVARLNALAATIGTVATPPKRKRTRRPGRAAAAAPKRRTA